MPDFGFNTPFDLQVGFLRRKLDLPTETWTDLWQSAHDRAFVVAGAMKADLLADLHAAVNKAAEQGTTLETFRQDFERIVAANGWTGWTGEDTAGGRAWRTKVIYQTNMAASYAAGRWAQINDPALADFRPYITYHHADGVIHPRPLHLAWNGLTLPKDHPFWRTHAPPNGWGCHCYASAASAKDRAKAEAAGKAEPPAGWQDLDPKTGAPIGIDRGWAYAPGANTTTPLRDMVADKLITFPPAIARALTRDMNKLVAAGPAASDFAAQVLADRSITTPLWLGFAERAQDIAEVAGVDVTGYPVLLPAETPRHVDLHHRYDGNDQRPPTPADYDQVLSVLNDYDSIHAGEPTDGHARLVASRRMNNGERFKATFEVRPGKRNRSLALVTLVVKR
jgi:hypothetical protein